MSDARVEAIIALGLDEPTAKRAIATLEAFDKGLKSVEKQAAEVKKRFREMAQDGERMRSVGLTFAGFGGAITAPFLAAAEVYKTRFAGMEATANRYIKAQQRSADATAALGRVAATALTPALEKVADLMDGVARFSQEHPDLVQGAINAGSVLVAGGGALAVLGQVKSTLGKIGELTSGSGFLSSASSTVVVLGALAVGAKGAEVLINKLGEASGNTYMAHYKLSDALETVRAALAIFTSLIPDATLTVGRVIEIGRGLDGLFERAINKTLVFFEAARDAISTAIADAIALATGQVKPLNETEKTGFLVEYSQSLAKSGLSDQKRKDLFGHAAEQTQSPDFTVLDAQLQLRNIEYAKHIKEIDDKAIKLGNSLGTLDDAFSKGIKDWKASLGNVLVNFVKTGSLGPMVDGLISKVFGGGGSGSSGGSPLGVNPEAVKAFIDYKKQVAASDKQYAVEQKQAKVDYDKANLKADADYQDQQSKINQDYMTGEAKAYSDFRRGEEKQTAQYNKERLRTIQDAADSLYDAAASNDVVAFLNAARTAEKTLRRQSEDEDAATKQRTEDFLQQRKEAQSNFEKQLDDLSRSHDKEQKARDVAYREQLNMLRDKHAAENNQLFQHFAETLSAYSQNYANLQGIQTQFFADSAAQFSAWVDANQTKLQDAIGAMNGLTSGASGGSTANAALVAATYRIGGTQSFDKGTAYVDRDQLAWIHKGERVLTAAQNRAGASGHSVTVDLRGATLSGGATQADLQAVKAEVYKGVAMAWDTIAEAQR